MSLDISPAKSMSRVLYRRLCEIKALYGIDEMARLMACSRSQAYRYVHSVEDEAEQPSAGEVLQLAYSLADRYDDYSMIYLMLPGKARIEVPMHEHEADGLCDERRELSEIMWRIYAEENDADALDEVAARIDELGPRVRIEAAAVRSRTSRKKAIHNGETSRLG